MSTFSFWADATEVGHPTGHLLFWVQGGGVLLAFKVLRSLDLIRTFDNEDEALASFRPKSF